MNGRDLIKWKPPVIDAHVHDSEGKDVNSDNESWETSHLSLLLSVGGMFLIITVIAGVFYSRFSEEASLVLEEPLAKLTTDAEQFGILIPGETKGTSLYAAWNRGDKSFWMEIRDERPNTVWHVDVVKHGEPGIDVVLKTAELKRDNMVLRYSEQKNSPYLHQLVGWDIPQFLNDQYLNVFVCATEENLRFNTDQQQVKNALKKYFFPAVRAEENLVAIKKAQEAGELATKKNEEERNRAEPRKGYDRLEVMKQAEAERIAEGKRFEKLRNYELSSAATRKQQTIGSKRQADQNNAYEERLSKAIVGTWKGNGVTLFLGPNGNAELTCNEQQTYWKFELLSQNIILKQNAPNDSKLLRISGLESWRVSDSQQMKRVRLCGYFGSTGNDGKYHFCDYLKKD